MRLTGALHVGYKLGSCHNIRFIISHPLHSPTDLCHSAAMLSLQRIKSYVFAWQALPRCKFSTARLAVQKQSFLFSQDSTWPLSGKPLLHVYTLSTLAILFLGGCYRSQNFQRSRSCCSYGGQGSDPQRPLTLRCILNVLSLNKSLF